VKQQNLKTWFKSGTPWVWMNAGAVAIAILMTLGLLSVIAVRGLAHFWPADVIVADYQVPGSPARVVAGEVVEAEEVPRARLAASGLPVDVEGGEFMTRELLKVGNREVYGADFTWVVGEWLSEMRRPAELMAVERREWGNFYGYLVNVKEQGQVVAEGADAWTELQQRIARVDELHAQIAELEKVDIGRINHGLERLRLRTRQLELGGRLDATAQADLDAERAEWDAQYKALESELVALNQQFSRDSMTVRTADGREMEINLGKVVRAYQPNDMSIADKLGFYFAKLWEFVSDEPREANTEGGIFPAIFGTVLMTIIMAVIVTPFGVIAAVYLREEGLARIPRMIREGSLALGATKSETLWKVVLPMASPAMMTGLILAVARAAGEVAPLMLVGVVKLAPTLPLNGNYPYLHLDQKIMHLGFHIYDVGFQSPNVEAARPLVYATALLLVLVIAILNFSAVVIRNHLREKYKALDH